MNATASKPPAKPPAKPPPEAREKAGFRGIRPDTLTPVNVTATLAAMYRLSEIDVRLLHVFRAVVECRGFTNAQASLNIRQSTISNHIGQLEQRLGFRLCDRGVTGFRLTRKGRRVYDETLTLFKAHENFQNITAELKGKLSGFLKIGVIDSTITDPDCPIVRGINLFNKKANEVAVQLALNIPDKLERMVLDMDVDIAIGTFVNILPGLDYKAIYTEHNTLYCNRDHPIAGLTHDRKIHAAVRESRKVVRSYLDGKDLSPLGVEKSGADASVEFLEAAAILLLSGDYIGFLPTHFARNWVESGQLVPILPDQYVYESDFFIVTRKTMRKSVAVETFMSGLFTAVEEIRSESRPAPVISVEAARG